MAIKYDYNSGCFVFKRFLLSGKTIKWNKIMIDKWLVNDIEAAFKCYRRYCLSAMISYKSYCFPVSEGMVIENREDPYPNQ